MGRSRRPYPDEYKRDALDLVRTSGKSLREIAGDLGISHDTLRQWKLEEEGMRPVIPLSVDERAELERLRGEVRTLRLERELLKKATAFFAQESDRTR